MHWNFTQHKLGIHGRLISHTDTDTHELKRKSGVTWKTTPISDAWFELVLLRCKSKGTKSNCKTMSNCSAWIAYKYLFVSFYHIRKSDMIFFNALVYLTFQKKNCFQTIICIAGIGSAKHRIVLKIRTFWENCNLRLNFPTRLCTRQKINS